MSASSQTLLPQAPAASAAVPEPDAANQPTTKGDRYSIVVTLLIAVGLGALATFSTKQIGTNASTPWVIWLAVAVGGLGGLAHEVAQSGGKILFFERKLDGFYIGSLGGVILGAVAGLLAARGFIVNPGTLMAGPQPGPIPMIFEIFFAGLALKGVTEAVGGRAVDVKSSSGK